MAIIDKGYIMINNVTIQRALVYFKATIQQAAPTVGNGGFLAKRLAIELVKLNDKTPLALILGFLNNRAAAHGQALPLSAICDDIARFSMGGAPAPWLYNEIKNGLHVPRFTGAAHYD